MTTTLPNFVTALGSKMTSFKKISALLVLLLISSLSFGQNAIVGTGFSTGWGGGSCPTGNSNFKYLSLITGANGTGTYGVTTAANGTGDQYMRFGIDWSTTNGQYAINPGTDTAILPNTSYNLNIGCTVSGSQFINVGSTSYNYVFKTFNAGTNPTGTFAFFEVQGAVQSVSSVSQSPVAASVVPSSNVTVTANLSGSLSTGQAVYLRYTNNAFANSTVVQMTGSGSTYTAQIPSSMNGQNKTVAYYVFTSGNSLNSANSGATGVYANGNNADLFTINLNNNGGSNYSYTVANSPVIVNATTGTVGPTGYATFAAAVTAINAGTHTGVVTVSIVGATTEGTANIPINASGSGSASYTSITVKPAGGAQTLTAATVAGSAFITLNGADNVTFDGLNTNGNSLTISNTTVSAASGTCTLSFIGDATSNTVTNCIILGSSTMAAGTNGGNIFFGAGAVSVGNDNNTISNCNIGPAGANLPTKAIHFGGTSNALNNSGIVINNNNIYDYFGAAVESAGIYITTGTQDASITNNRFYQTASRTQTTASLHSGIKILNSTSAGLYTISGNTIGYASSTGTGSYTLVGIAGTLFNPINLTVGTTTATSIQGNTIKAIAMSGAASGTSTSSPFIGIYVASGLSTIGDVTANTIGDMAATGSITYTSSSTSASDVIGMYNFGSSNWTTNNNNIGGITVSNSSTGAVGFYGLRCNTGSGVTWTCNNNIIGGSVAFSLDNTKAATGSSSNGILNSNPIGTFTGNLIRNMRVAGGTGTGTSSSMIGLRIDATSAQTVSQNQIYNLTNSNSGATAVTVLGIRNASTATNTFSKNLIYNFGVATSVVSNLTGIEFTGTYGTNTVSNNMIRMGYDATGAVLAGGHALNGIFVSASGATNNFYFNSVYVGGTGVTGTTATYAFNNTSTGTRIIRNNIFSNARSNGTGTGKHYAIKEGSTTGLTINYNDYFANGTGGVLGILTSDRATLSAWQTATTQDANSQNGDPQFIAPTSATPDLHIHATNPTPIEGTGLVVATVTDDYDSQTRSGLTPTDMGADAGNFVSSIAACATPTAQPTALTFSNVTTTTLSGSFTAASPVPTGYVVIRSTSSTLSGNPVDGISYTAGTSLGGGIVIVPTGTTFTDSALTAGTTYYYFVLSYNSGACSGGPKYLTTTPLTNNQVTVCATATALAAGTVTATSATLNWTGAGNYIVEYGAAGFTPGTGATTGVGGTIATSAGTNPYTLSGLTANTTYDVYVRQVCAAGGFYSANATKVTFTTACVAITSFPSVEPFASYLPSACWAEGDLGDLTAGPATTGASVSDWGVDGFLNSGSTGAAKMNIDAATGSEWIISPYYTIPATGYRVKYSVGATQFGATTVLTTAWEADDFVQLLVSTSNTNWTVLKTYNSANVPSNLGQTDDVDLTAYNGQTVHFAFRAFEGATNGSADIDFFIDNFTVEISPSCLPATINTTTSITSTTATINWAASASAPSNGYNYEIRTSGTAGSGATGLSTSGTVGAGIVTANVTGLTAATTYSVYVQSDCGGNGTSSWSTAGTFTTACTVPNNPGTISVTAPSATGFTLNYAAATPAPTNYILFNSTGTVATAIPTLVTGTTYTNATAYTFGGNSYNCISNTSASPQVLTGGTSNTQYNYFLYSKNTTNSCFGNPYYSTGISVSTITCPAAPTLPVSSSITTSSATVSWTASAVGGGAGTINYTLEVYTDAVYTTPISGSPFTMGTSVSQALSGLSASTTYYYRVKANNGSCDSTYLAGSFVTTCVALNVPYSQNFDSVTQPTLPNCMTALDSNADTFTWVTCTSTSFGNSTAITPNSGANQAGIRYNSSVAMNDWLILPGINMTGSTSYRLSFYARGYTGLTETFEVKYGTSATAAAMTTAIAASTTISGGTAYTLYTYDFTPSATGVNYIGIHGISASNQWYIFVDDIKVDLSPLPITITPSPSATICNGDSTTLTASSSAAYTYTWSPATGLSATTGATVSANPTTTTIYTVTGEAGSMTNTQTITVTVNPAPAAVTITPSTTTCPNVITTLTASSASIGTYTVGTSSGSSAAANTPYRQAVGAANHSRVQYLISKAELNAAGINSAANLTSLGFNVTTAGSGTMSNYTISMTNTNLTVLTATYQTPTFTTVFSGTNILPVSGINTHTFSSPFAWDGTSNILINICHQGAGGTTATVSIVTPTNVSTTSGAGSNQCNLTTGGATNASRPVMIFGVAGQITWAPTTDLYTDSGATTSYSGGAAVTVYTKPTATRTYTATASLGSCTKTNTSTITTKIPVGITSVTAGASPICAVATTTLTANGVVGDGAVVTWYTGSGATGTNLGTGSTLTAGPGTYYSYVTGDCGTPAEATVTVGTKVNVEIISVTAASNPICSSATTLLTANGVVGDGAIVTWYTGSGGTGTNLGTGVTTTKGPGTYYARVTGDCGTAEANFTINAIAEPTWANLQWPPTGAICQTGSYNAYGQVYQSGVTDSAGQGSGITVQFGYNGTDTDPSTWTSWSAASYNVDYGNNDEYLYTFTPPSSGTFYYTFRYRQGSCNWIYGGYSAGGGGAWSGSNVSGILTVTASPTVSIASNNSPVCSGAASFSLTGSTDAVVTYNINGGTNATTTLTGGAATISVPNPFASQVLTLVSVANNGCTSSLSDTSTVSVIATTYDGTSWSNGNPDSSKLAIFTGNYTIAADLTACSLRVTNNAVVTVNSNYNVYLNGAITVDSGSSFTMNNNTNLLQSDASAVNTGNIIVKRNTSTIVRLDHTLWSSPVTGQNLFSFSPNTLVNRFYVYNTATNSYVTTGLSNTSLFTPAKGFAVRAPNNQSATTPAVWTGTFTGVPNNGTKTFTLATNAANGYNYNLVGNPYPSAISASNFYAANASKIGGTLYFYAHTLTMNASGIFPTGTNYATWTGLGGAAATEGDGHTPPEVPNGIIQVGQGFIVRATASGDVTFTNAMRVANQQNQFMKAATASAETHRMWLNLKTDTGVDVNQILVGYMDGATQGVDAGLDGLSFGNTGSYLYSKIENDNFVIQARSLPFDVTDEVPLGFNCATAGSYSISLTNTDGLFAADQDILVRDNLTGTDTSIKTVPYTFNSETGVFDTRFRLVYTQALGVPSTNFTENSVIVYKNTDWFHVNTKGIEMKDIMVYDISGRLIYSKKEINATTAVLNGLTTTNQVLILKINSIEDKTVTIKVIN
ncbi:choice-of-anchor J domain-containing protein [Flavobacterium sp.]|jgi:hypothetical protein|uniref:choice-of-anchor J domain-containing protein n=1 Tax=Flavobacterium sp. TaxID=239 RepID=UPI0037BE6D46